MKRWVMLAVLAAATGCSAGNLLVNGDMKNDKAWAIWGKAPRDAKTRAEILSYVNEGPNGARVLKMNDSFADFNPYVIQWIAVNKPAGVYKLSCSIKAAAGKTVLVMVQMMGKDPATGKVTKFLGAPEESVSCTGDWQKCEFVFPGISPAAEKLGVAFCPQEKLSDKSQTGSFLLTGVSFESLP